MTHEVACNQVRTVRRRLLAAGPWHRSPTRCPAAFVLGLRPGVELFTPFRKLCEAAGSAHRLRLSCKRCMRPARESPPPVPAAGRRRASCVRISGRRTNGSRKRSIQAAKSQRLHRIDGSPLCRLDAVRSHVGWSAGCTRPPWIRAAVVTRSGQATGPQELFAAMEVWT
jgi:hypothetical protein